MTENLRPPEEPTHVPPQDLQPVIPPEKYQEVPDAAPYAPEESTAKPPGMLQTAVGGVKRWLARRRGELPVSSEIRGGYENATITTLAERHPDWPRIEASFFFSAHANAKDMEDLEVRIKGADVYLYEFVGGDDYQKGTSSLTRGLQTLTAPENKDIPVEYFLNAASFNGKAVYGSAFEPVMRGLHGSNTILGSIDQSKEESEELSKINAIPFRVSDTLQSSVDDYAKEIERVADLQTEREQVMAGRFENEIARILKAHPELKKKKDLQVLVSLGALHTGVDYEFRRIGITTKRVFASHSGAQKYMYDYRHQAMRQYQFNRQPSREIIENAWFEEALERATKMQPHFGPPSGDLRTNDIAPYLRETVDVLDDRTRQRVFSAIKNESDNLPIIIDEVNRALERAGKPPLPQNAAELEYRVAHL